MYFLFSIIFKFLLSVNFHEKFNMLKLIRGGEYCKLNNFFWTIGIHHHLIFPYTHEQN